MKIIVDMMGGDNAPLAVLEGTAQAVKEYGVQVIGVGSEELVRKTAAEHNIPLDGIELVNVVARAVPEERLRPEVLADLTVSIRDGKIIPLSQAARLEYVYEEPILWRQNRDLTITVRAEVVQGVQAPDVT